MSAHNPDATKGGKERGEVKGEYGRIWEEEGNADYGGMVQPSQQHVAPYVKGVEWEFNLNSSRLPTTEAHIGKGMTLYVLEIGDVPPITISRFRLHLGYLK